MAELTEKKRDKIPSKEFGLPGERKYPMENRAHAANAKARATQMVEKGKLSEEEKEKIDAKANRILGKKDSEKKDVKEKEKDGKKVYPMPPSRFQKKDE